MPASPRDHCTGFRLSRRWHGIDNPLWYNNSRRSDVLYRKEFGIFFSKQFFTILRIPVESCYF